MILKDTKTVSLGPMHPSLHHALNVIDRVWREHTGNQARITGLGEEGHSRGSLHYGVPGDIRLRAADVDADEQHLPAAKRPALDAELRKRLGVGEFDLVWEGLGTPYAHLHIEVDWRLA
jgi:hypothetical protein